jgi:hypothetical protein
MNCEVRAVVWTRLGRDRDGSQDCVVCGWRRGRESTALLRFRAEG